GWGSDARGKAHVHVAIIGLTRREDEPSEKRLFSYPDINGDPDESRHTALSPYLFDASNLADRHMVAVGRSSPLGPVARVMNGSVAADGGHLILSPHERSAILDHSPECAPFIR